MFAKFCSTATLLTLASLPTPVTLGFLVKERLLRSTSCNKPPSTLSRPCSSSHRKHDNSTTMPATTPSTLATVPSLRLPLSDRCFETLDPCVVLMKDMISEYRHLWQDDEIYSLAQGVVYWDPPTTVYQRIDAALQDTSASNLHMYCDDEGLLELRTALQHKLTTENALSQHQVVVTAGANQAFMNCVLAFLSRNSKCVVFRPYYFNHVMAVQLVQGNEGLVVGDCNEHGIPDVDWLEMTLQADETIRMVTLVNPGNPTGVSLTREKIQEFVNVCAQHSVWLVLDCTYEHFDHSSTDSSLFAGFEEEHVVHIFSFSKGHALAGFRCGYVVLSSHNQHGGQNAYQQMLKVQDTIPICPSRMSQIAALGALEAGRSWVVDKVATLHRGRIAILQAMRPLDPIMGGTGAMYVMGKLPEGLNDDRAVARTLVRDFGVAVIPGSFCGFPGWIRVCYSNLPPKKCEVAASRLGRGLEQICTKGAC